jgi:hypothetical protein
MELHTWTTANGEYVYQPMSGDLFVGTHTQLATAMEMKDAVIERSSVYGTTKHAGFQIYWIGWIKADSPGVMACRECFGKQGMHGAACSVFLKAFHVKHPTTSEV